MRSAAALALLLVACGGPPAWPEEATLSVDEASARHVTFSWPAAQGEVSAYVVRLDGEDAARLDPHVTRYGADELEEATEHQVEVVAVGPGGEESTALDATARTLDGTPPAWEADGDGLIGGLTPIDVRVEEDGTHLSWPAATDAVGVTRYRVLRGDEELGVVEAPATELDLENATWEGPVELAVVALDAADNASEPGLTMRWTPPTAEPGIAEAEGTRQASARLAIERQQAVVEQMLLGALGGDGDGLADVLSAGAVTNNAADVLARSEGVGVYSGDGLRSGGGGGGTATSLGGLRARQGGGAVSSGPPATGRLTETHRRGRAQVRLVRGDASRPDAERIVRARLRVVNTCYERELQRERFEGPLGARLQVTAAGSVSGVSITEPLREVVDACVRSALRSTRFGSGEAATIDVRYTLSPMP